MTDTPKAPKPPAVTFSQTGRARSKDIPLEWPVIVDGVELKHITIRRLTGGEVAGLQERLEANNTDEALILEFVDQPIEVLNALDQDDIATLGDAVFDFLPRRLRESIEAAAKAQFPTGDLSSETSPTPSSGEKTNS